MPNLAAEHYLNTGQVDCYDLAGNRIPCPADGQDGQVRPGAAWPEPRFEDQGEIVLDRLTGLFWLKDANPAGFPLTWPEALDFAAQLAEDGFGGRRDWRLPNRRELFSLISFRDRKPALPGGHPFSNVFLGWYWTSTSAAINPAYAWYVHTEGGRMFYGHKQSSYLIWPLAGQGNGLLPVTGQTICRDLSGKKIDCPGSGQDGEIRAGVGWPVPRFQKLDRTVLDRLTNLVWTEQANLTGKPVPWATALGAAAKAPWPRPSGYGPWRLPTINELESLIDVANHTPALPGDHPFTRLGDVYASSTTSSFETDWCMALHLNKGAVGVGHKTSGSFTAWAVCSPA